MRIIKLTLILGTLVLSMAMACNQSGSQCPKDAGGNTDCPLRQHNPPDGPVNDGSTR